MPLKGTKWKLKSVNYRGKFEVFEPNDCDTCYTLTFDTETTGHGISILNTINITRNSDKLYLVDKITVTELDEPYDGNLFSDLMRSVNMIALESVGGRFGTTLGLDIREYNPGRNATLIFKLLDP